MQVPKRKPGKYTHQKLDPHITVEKHNELKNEMEKLKKSQPHAAKEVARLAEMGDFSENAAYQMAKGRLRGINNRISEIQEYLKTVVIIEPNKNTDEVGLNSQVTIKIEEQEKTYLILGSSESSPENGIISHVSPIGLALMGKKVGDLVTFQTKQKSVSCTILKIE